MKKWLTWLINPAVVYFIYLGLLMPFVNDEHEAVVIVLGVPFAISTAYLWQRTRLGGILRRPDPPLSGTVEADKFFLKDTSGRARAVLGVTDYGPCLNFYDASGAVRASMGLFGEAPFLTVSDKEGASKVELTDLADGPHVVLYDANHQLRAIFDVLEAGPRLELYDREGNSRAKITAAESGPQFSLFDANEKAVYSAP
jgi:hypothetical protein